MCDLCGGPRPTNIWSGQENLSPLGPGVLRIFLVARLNQSKQSKQPLTEEIRLLSEAMKYIYFLIEIDEKDTKSLILYDATS